MAWAEDISMVVKGVHLNGFVRFCAWRHEYPPFETFEIAI
jgi:hypothetical protein